MSRSVQMHRKNSESDSRGKHGRGKSNQIDKIALKQRMLLTGQNSRVHIK